MHRITVTEAERDFGNLVNRVCSEGVSVDLERDDKVVAHLVPATLRSPLPAGDLNKFLRGLPKLEDDADAFLDDLLTIRRKMPAEADPWA